MGQVEWDDEIILDKLVKRVDREIGTKKAGKILLLLEHIVSPWVRCERLWTSMIPMRSFLNRPMTRKIYRNWRVDEIPCFQTNFGV